ncbi:PPK2 family polyphosphate kinase [Salinicoccus halodurans]|uniref:Phosphate:nucleotide phosphotransferase n=1 Tax=Salinicoccus halodurans TaxID=407035 RepID=A0A0F7HJI2_9STAP|nr:phosphate--nucleotide phosphotransferase [Salinicoccus halodurans]AKG73534.1 phosphate:nucleotide phosphotransferase [Salinicoccus halodurans]SFK52192.1 polyphosphate:nucleotide phosphotransferase, PPK2 family [Salinicoccus halodurans]
MKLKKYRMPHDEYIELQEYPTSEDKTKDNDEIRSEVIPPLVEKLKDLHLRLNAEEKNGILVVLQALDAAGKDETISYIFSNLNAQGLKTTTFGKPTETEQKHDYLWRMQPAIPARGEIGILNRSHYEDVIAPRIHGGLEPGDFPEGEDEDSIWNIRFRQINDYEKYLYENGIHVVKFFFNMSKDEQKDRLLERMKTPDKNWEFSFSDVEERQHWDEYQQVFEEMLNGTSTSYSPWYVLPADDEWHSRRLVTAIMIDLLERLDPKFPEITGEDKDKLKEYIDKLEKE